MTAIQESPGFFRLRSLLEAGNWRAEDDMIASALPHFIDQLDPLDAITALENLGIKVSGHSCRVTQITAADCPALYQPTDGPMIGILDRDDSKFLVHRSDSYFPNWTELPPSEGVLISIGRNGTEHEAETRADNHEVTALRQHLRGFSPQLVGVFFVALLTNLLAFAPAIFIMVLYDRVIPTGSQSLLTALVLGMALVLTTDLLLRYLRNRVISDIGAEVDRFMGKLLFRKLMSLPLDQLTKSDVDQQFNRLKQFESLRDAFTGPALVSFFDLPFTVFFGVAIFLISPTLGLCVLGTGLTYLLAYLVFAPIQHARQTTASASRLAVQTLQTEILSNQNAICRLGVQNIWLERIDQRICQAAEDARSAKQISMIMQTFGQSLMMLAGAMTILVGAKGAIDGTLTLGALVATMALVWRVLSPLQAIYGAAAQIKGHFRSLTQIERLASLPEELRNGVWQARTRNFKGHVELAGVSFRYRAQGDPVVSGISLTARPGEILAITGPNGAGKSTILNLIASLYTPMAGALRVDGMDARQIPVDDLRGAISFSLQSPEFFYGTIAQNFRMNNILATDEEIWQAIRDVGLEDEIRDFPKGIETPINDAFYATVSKSVLKSLSVSRALVKDAAIYVFDEPANGLDRTHDAAVMRKLRALSEDRTVILCTRFADHLRSAHRAIFMIDGRIAIEGTGPEVLTQLDGHELGSVLQ